jgi:hypothetical protein
VQTDPSQDAAILLASFEAGKEGWAADADNPDIGFTNRASDWSTDGDFSLRIDPTSGGFFGREFGARDLTGKRAVRVDIKTMKGPPMTRIAIQLTVGDDYFWCESADDLDATGTASIDLGTMRCYLRERPVARPSDLTEVRAVWLYLNKGSFRVDNVRAE